MVAQRYEFYFYHSNIRLISMCWGLGTWVHIIMIHGVIIKFVSTGCLGYSEFCMV